MSAKYLAKTFKDLSKRVVAPEKSNMWENISNAHKHLGYEGIISDKVNKTKTLIPTPKTTVKPRNNDSGYNITEEDLQIDQQKALDDSEDMNPTEINLPVKTIETSNKPRKNVDIGIKEYDLSDEEINEMKEFGGKIESIGGQPTVSFPSSDMWDKFVKYKDSQGGN